MTKTASTKSIREAYLALADGTVFQGRAIGYDGEATGEVVFNTSMSGYQEILTDPSYRFQMLTFTYPHIGNVGVNPDDVESDRVQVGGLIVRHLSPHYSNFRATGSLDDYLVQNKIAGISDIDTRELVLHLRDGGSQMGVIAHGKQNADELVDKARNLPSMEGLDLVKVVSTREVYSWNQGTWVPGKGYPKFSDAQQASKPHIIAIDFGIKYNILRLMVDQGFRVTVVPCDFSGEQILKMKPDGIFLSNGPGDPAVVSYAIETTKQVLGKTPIFGICLGHQILGHALGIPTFKLKFGHRGGNHPVRNELTGAVEITVQNHGFASVAHTRPKGVRITHMNLNDQTIEGLELKEAGAFSVQYHPEASPGPMDAQYLFDRFKENVAGFRK